MRNAAGLIFAGAISFALVSAAWAQAPAKGAAPAPAAAAKSAPPAPPTPPAPPAPPPGPKVACNGAPDALGVSRVVQIDTTGGPGFGFEHFKQLDFLKDKEGGLTFDDGPWPANTPAALKALADQCTTRIFFALGKHATHQPQILPQGAPARPTPGPPTP